MKITYLFRSPGTGHSIESLFGNIQQEVSRQSALIVGMYRLPHISHSLGAVCKNSWFIRRKVLDGIIHITGDVHYAALVVPKSRTVLTIHDCITLEKNKNNPVRYGLFWLLWFYLPVRRAAAVTVVSEKSRQELIRYLGRVARKAVVVPNAYSPSLGYHRANFNKTEPRLLQIGTAPHKNLLRLIRALDGIACKLIIVGPIPSVITAALSVYRIHYENYSDLSEVVIKKLYVECDLVTFVSTYEGFGMPILEANAVGRAVLTANRSPMNDVAGKAALLVDPTDVKAIRSGIQTLIENDTLRESLIAEGLQNASRYTVSAAATRYLSIYNQLKNAR